uniref:CUB domain-containing protein n=1 Tax=Caenorhabditis tropicalis TaxID=1561998 RepID=A0A1I7UT45_9PELO
MLCSTTFFLFFFFKLLEACIPTQNVEAVDPFPCNVCSKVYATYCQGPNLPSASNWCSTESEVGLTYTLGPSSYLFEPTACNTELSCPSGTIGTFDATGGGELMEYPLGTTVPVYCAESGPEAGKWLAWITNEAFAIDLIRCQNY